MNLATFQKMKHYFPKSRLPFWPMFFLGIIQLCMCNGLTSSASPTYGNEYDLPALLDFRSRITQDPLGIMKFWNDSVHFCHWFGVTCSPNSERVMILNLENQRLAGSLPPSIGNLTRLMGINLRYNSFRGEIPPEIGRLHYLQHINLTFNSFEGKIPANMTHCKRLKLVDFGSNNLTGTIPPWIGNLSSLFGLSLAENNFHGSIPEDLGRLKSLGLLELSINHFSGSVPPSIYNISSIFYFVFAVNQLQGKIPPDVGTAMPNLVLFAGGANRFTGQIPQSLSNASALQVLDFSINGLTGAVPHSLGSLRDLSRLYFDDNRLGSGRYGDLDIIKLLINCTSLKVLGLARNFFGGELPNSIANLSTRLNTLTLGNNLLHGRIPTGIGNLINLTLLGLEGNQLSGSVPDELGKLRKLSGLYLNINKFTGRIPYSFGNLTSLTRLFMEENRLEGNIPPSLGRCRTLLVLNLSSNNLNGSIPREVMKISSLSISLTLSNNSLTGSLPNEVGELNSLSELDVSGNKLSGEIPSSLGKCIALSSLHLEDNQFEGKIPQSLESLRGLEEIDLAHNNLSGPIPEFLSKFSALKHLNLSHNNFEGKLSREGIFSNASVVSVLGNKKLCGGIPELLLPTCPDDKPHSSRKIFSKNVVILVICFAVLVVILSTVFVFWHRLRRSRRRPLNSSSMEDTQCHVSYSDLFESTNGFSTENLIGSGSFGSVYKGLLAGSEKPVAVKVLNLEQQGALKSFFDECQTLRSVRHRNLLKIITACSSIDRQGNDFRSLVFEFMPNGNLDEWLHPRNGAEQHQIKRLSFVQRLDIAIDVAAALDYLHNSCETPIVHCDLKPSNILLDDDMVAHVSDFGLASFLFEASEDFPEKQTLQAGLKGSIGYIPPEYGMGGTVSILGDSYSYGVLLLEMFTGKRPTDDMFKDGLSIHQFVHMAFSDHVMDIVDPSLLIEETDGDDDVERNESDMEEKTILEDGKSRANDERRMEDCLVSVMRIGLLCSNVSPTERLLMNAVVNKMHAIRNSYLKFKDRGKG